MQGELYADVFFLINLVMDVLIFWVVSMLIKRKTKFFKLLKGGLIIATLYCLILFVPMLKLFYNFYIMQLVLILGILYTFSPKSIKEFFKLILFFYISAFSVGGLGIALFYFSNITTVIGNNISFNVKDFSIKILVVVSCITYIFIKLSSSWYKRVIVKKQTFYQTKIFIDGENILFNALLDTGNSLSDPLSDYPVIIAEFNTIKELLPNNIKLLFYENKENEIMSVISDIGDSFQKRIRMIPFESIGKKDGILLGFRPDKVEINKENSVITLSEVIIGIYNFSLSKDNAYQGLLNPIVILNEA